MDDELRSLFGEENDDEEEADDLLAAFSGDPLNDDLFAELDTDLGLGDDPFAALDEPIEDDAFADLTVPTPLVAEPLVPVAEEDDFDALPVEPEMPAGDMPEWLRDLGMDEPAEPLPAPVTAETPVAPPPMPVAQPRRGGMTPQQRMVLALFFFLDVLVLGFLILVVMGIIQI